MKEEEPGHRNDGLVRAMLLVFAVSMAGALLNALIFFAGKLLEWIK